MENLALPIFILIAALVLLGFAALIRSARKANATRHLEAENLGFRVQDPPDSALIEKIRALHYKRPSQVLDVRRVFSKPHGDGSMYLFDLVDTGGEDTSTLLDGAFAIVSPLLALPNFGLFPRVPGEGYLSRVANQLIERLLDHQAGTVDFDDRPDFDRRYLVTADDPQAVRDLLDDYLQDRLSALEMLQIQAGGDMLTVGNVGYAQKKPDQHRDLETLYRQTLTVYELFRQSQGN